MDFKRRSATIAAVIVTVMLLTVVVQAYDVVDVRDGGTIAGIVTLSGPIPAPKAFNLVMFPDAQYCGRISNGKGYRLLRDFTVQSAGDVQGLKDVVVFLEGVEAGKPFDLSVPRVEARDCQFMPFVTVVRDGHAVEVVNMDPVMHDIQAYETSQLGPRVLFNSPLPMNPHHKRNVTAHSHEHLAGEPMTEKIDLTKGRRIFVMQCGFHAYMISWGMAMEHPYYAVTGPDGRYTIGDVPPGEYRLMGWHPEMGFLEKSIKVDTKATVNVPFEFKAPTGRRSAHEMVENPHFGLESLGKPMEIIPTLKRQIP
jgi:hypothetical protein